MMEVSSWSEAESGVTMVQVSTCVGEGAAMCEGERTDAFFSPRRSVLPKVQPAVNMSDQQVPVYRDQMVPVWPASCNDLPEAASVKRKLVSKLSRIGHGEGRRYTYLRIASPGDDSSSKGTEREGNGGYGSRRNSGDAIDQVSNVETVSFDDIMSIYQSSILEETSLHKWSRALRAILNHRSRKRRVYSPRLWLRKFAKNLDSSATVNGSISVQLKCSLLGQRHHVSTDVDESLLRSLQEAIEKTSICDSSSSSTSRCNSSGMTNLLPSDHAIFQVQRCQVQRHCDNLTFATPNLLTTTSS